MREEQLLLWFTNLCHYDVGIHAAIELRVAFVPDQAVFFGAAIDPIKRSIIHPHGQQLFQLQPCLATCTQHAQAVLGKSLGFG